MTNRYAEDIIDIVGIDKTIKGALPDPADRQSIDAQRGIGYINGKTGGVGSVSGTPGETLITDENDGKDTDGIYDGSSTAPNPYNTFQQAFTLGENTFDIIDIFDGVDGPTPTDPLSSDFNSPTGAGSMNTITGITDCTSGDTIEVHTNGQFPPIEETTGTDGTVMTPEWPDPETPPASPNFQSGYYWEMSGSGNPNLEQAATPYEAAELARQYLDANPAGSDVPPYAITDLTVNAGSPPSRYDVEFTVDTATVPRSFTLTASRVDCIITPPDDAGSCPASAPAVTGGWPNDDKITFKFTNGQFTTSQYDNDVPINWSTPTSKLNFCATGGRFGSLELLGGGDYALYETSTSGGSPSGVVRVYRADGTMKAATDAAGLDAYKTTN